MYPLICFNFQVVTISFFFSIKTDVSKGFQFYSHGNIQIWENMKYLKLSFTTFHKTQWTVTILCSRCKLENYTFFSRKMSVHIYIHIGYMVADFITWFFPPVKVQALCRQCCLVCSTEKRKILHIALIKHLIKHYLILQKNMRGKQIL